MDAELFKKVEPRHCLGFVWCQRPNGSQEYLAPTVRATINQFLHVSGCVITTCLGDLSMTAQDRARVVELWIQVAKECRVLGNYASLRAIVSALQSPSISRLQKTWGRVARKSSRKLKEVHQRPVGEQEAAGEVGAADSPSGMLTQVLVGDDMCPRRARASAQGTDGFFRDPSCPDVRSFLVKTERKCHPAVPWSPPPLLVRRGIRGPHPERMKKEFCAGELPEGILGS
nr:ral guanine nucleotide dissociation stimulator-like [Equus asinus]